MHNSKPMYRLIYSLVDVPNNIISTVSNIKIKFIEEFFCLHSTCLLQVDGLAEMMMDMVVDDLHFVMMDVLANFQNSLFHQLNQTFCSKLSKKVSSSSKSSLAIVASRPSCRHGGSKLNIWMHSSRYFFTSFITFLM